MYLLHRLHIHFLTNSKITLLFRIKKDKNKQSRNFCKNVSDEVHLRFNGRQDLIGTNT